MSAFNELRNALEQDPSSDDSEACFYAFRRAYGGNTRAFANVFAHPAERRRWVRHLFVYLLAEISVEVWNSSI